MIPHLTIKEARVIGGGEGEYRDFTLAIRITMYPRLVRLVSQASPLFFQQDRMYWHVEKNTSRCCGNKGLACETKAGQCFISSLFNLTQ